MSFMAKLTQAEMEVLQREWDLEDDHIPVDEYLVKMMIWISLSRLEDKEGKT